MVLPVYQVLAVVQGEQVDGHGAQDPDEGVLHGPGCCKAGPRDGVGLLGSGEQCREQHLWRGIPGEGCGK